MEGDGSTASLAVTLNATLAPPDPVASAVIGPGTDTLGGVESTRVTVTLNDAVAVFPAASVAKQLTGLAFPFAGKSEPDAGAQVTGTGPSTLSVAVGCR
jgi:hypothetical protein